MGNGAWTPRVTIAFNVDEELIMTDCMTILLPFYKLRKTPKVTIHVPETILAKRFAFEAIQRILQRKTPYGSFIDANDMDPWDDNRIQSYLDRIYMSLESQLNSLPGEATNMMRLERFVSWYDGDEKGDGKSKYLSEWERIFHGSEVSYDFDALRNRLWHVVKVAWQKFRFGLRYDDLKIQALLKSSWSTEEWRSYYPRGILPYSDVHCIAVLLPSALKLGEADRHAEGMSAREKSRECDRIQAQAALIDFRSGQRTKQAFDNVDVSHL